MDQKLIILISILAVLIIILISILIISLKAYFRFKNFILAESGSLQAYYYAMNNEINDEIKEIKKAALELTLLIERLDPNNVSINEIEKIYLDYQKCDVRVLNACLNLDKLETIRNSLLSKEV